MTRLEERFLAVVLSILIIVPITSIMTRLYYKEEYRTYLKEGDLVKLKKDSPISKHYNKCRIIVVGLRATHDDNQAWIKIDNCPNSNNKIITKIISQKYLIRVNDSGHAI